MGLRNKDWTGGMRARLYYRTTGDPADDLLIGYVWHPHVGTEGWLDSTFVTGFPPGITLGTSGTGTFTRKGHACPVRVRCNRNGVSEEHTMAANVSTLVLTTSVSESLDTFTVRGK